MSTTVEDRNELDEWGLHPDCIEDCCWHVRLAKAGGVAPITVDGITEAVRDGLLDISESPDGDIVFSFRFEMLDYITGLDPEVLVLAQVALREWQTLPVTKRFHTRTGGVIWSSVKQAAKMAFDAGMRTETQFRAWIGDEIAPSGSAGHFRAKLIDALLDRGDDPSDVLEALRGSSEDWGRRITNSEWRRVMERFEKRRGTVESRTMAVAA